MAVDLLDCFTLEELPECLYFTEWGNSSIIYSKRLIPFSNPKEYRYESIRPRQKLTPPSLGMFYPCDEYNQPIILGGWEL